MTALIDTNILVYAFDKKAETKHKLALEFVEKALNSEGEFFVSNQNLTELFNVIIKRELATVEEARTAVMTFVASRNLTKISYDEGTIAKAVQIYQKGLHFWDCLIAATALENEVTIIYTENVKDFKNIPGITVVNPFE